MTYKRLCKAKVKMFAMHIFQERLIQLFKVRKVQCSVLVVLCAACCSCRPDWFSALDSSCGLNKNQHTSQLLPKLTNRLIIASAWLIGFPAMINICLYITVIPIFKKIDICINTQIFGKITDNKHVSVFKFIFLTFL